MSETNSTRQRTYEVDIVGRRHEDILLKRTWVNRVYKWLCAIMAGVVMFVSSDGFVGSAELNLAMGPMALMFIALAYFFNERLRHARTIKKYRIRVGEMILDQRTTA